MADAAKNSSAQAPQTTWPDNDQWNLFFIRHVDQPLSRMSIVLVYGKFVPHSDLKINIAEYKLKWTMKSNYTLRNKGSSGVFHLHI
jgi:hypothetical protein